MTPAAVSVAVHAVASQKACPSSAPRSVRMMTGLVLAGTSAAARAALSSEPSWVERRADWNEEGVQRASCPPHDSRRSVADSRETTTWKSAARRAAAMRPRPEVLAAHGPPVMQMTSTGGACTP
eukprot:COSAG01_NODE_20_length_38868_cov_34.606071_11_plen_124_part_00